MPCCAAAAVHFFSIRPSWDQCIRRLLIDRRSFYIQMYVYAIDDDWTSRNCFWFPIIKLTSDQSGDFFLSILWFTSSSTTTKKTACESATSLGLIVFQFNSHILQWFYGVINSRNKGDASSDSIKESRQWVAGDVVVISSLLFWCLICIHWNWWILVVSSRGGFGLKVWWN